MVSLGSVLSEKDFLKAYSSVSTKTALIWIMALVTDLYCHRNLQMKSHDVMQLHLIVFLCAIQCPLYSGFSGNKMDIIKIL